MKRILIYILSAVLLTCAVLSTVGCTSYDGGAETHEAATSTITPEAEDPNKTKALDFTMLDEEGNEVRLFDLVGKPIVLNFWASWCPPCKAEMPDFEDAYKKYGEDVVFVMLNLTDGGRETVETAKAHVESCGYTFPVYFDAEYEGATVYRITSIPQTYFIDADGYVVSIARGMLDANSLEQRISMILEK